MLYNDYQLSALMREVIKGKDLGIDKDTGAYKREYGSSVSEHNTEVLIEYAPKLFNGIDIVRDEMKAFMWNLVFVIDLFESIKRNEDTKFNQKVFNINSTYNTKQRTAKALKEINFLLDYLGESTPNVNKQKISEPIIESLKKLRKSPEDYIAKKVRINKDRDIQNEFFKENDEYFKGKSLIVKEFINSITL